MAIAKATRNQPLIETHRAYLAWLWRAAFMAARRRRNQARVVGHKTAILDALMNRNIVALRAAIDQHLGQLTGDIRLVIDAGERQTQAPKTAEVGAAV